MPSFRARQIVTGYLKYLRTRRLFAQIAFTCVSYFLSCLCVQMSQSVLILPVCVSFRYSLHGIPSIVLPLNHRRCLRCCRRASSSFSPEASFGRRVLSLPVSVCVCLWVGVCMCVCVNYKFVRTITHHPFKLYRITKCGPEMQSGSRQPSLFRRLTSLLLSLFCSQIFPFHIRTKFAFPNPSNTGPDIYGTGWSLCL